MSFRLEQVNLIECRFIINVFLEIQKFIVVYSVSTLNLKIVVRVQV